MEFFNNRKLVIYSYSIEKNKLVIIENANLNYLKTIFNVISKYNENEIDESSMIDNGQSLSKNYKFKQEDEKKLILNFEGFLSIKQFAFKNLANLITINLSNNFIMDIYKNAFNGLKNLKILNLSKNQLEYIHKDAFNDLVNLNRIDLSYNQLKIIKKEYFINLENLKDLNISFNKLQSVHLFFNHKLNCINTNSIDKDKDFSHIDSIFHFGSLRELNNECLKNYFYRFFNKPDFLYLNGITEVVLDNCQIETLQKDTFKGLNNLTLIDLQYNEITKIDKETFHGLKELVSIKLQHNKLTEIDRDIFYRLISLVKVNLHSNELSHIDQETFHGLFNLKYIYLYNNFLSQKFPLYLEESVTHISLEQKRKNSLKNIINKVLYNFKFLKNTIFLIKYFFHKRDFKILMVL